MSEEDRIAAMAEELIWRLGGIGTPDEMKAALVLSRVVSALDCELARLRGLEIANDVAAFEVAAPLYMAVSADLADALADLSGGSTLFDHTEVWRRAGLHAAVSDAILERSDLRASA